MFVEPLPGSTGPAVVCSDGLAGSWPDWRPLAVELRGRARVYAVTRARTDLDGAARELLQAVDEIGVRRARLVGHSMGGFVVEAAARLQSERVESVTLLDTSVTPAGRVVSLFDRIGGEVLGRTCGRFHGLARVAGAIKRFGEPVSVRSEGDRRDLIGPLDSHPDFWRTVGAELVAYRSWADRLEVLRAEHPLGSIDIAVVTAVNPLRATRWHRRQAELVAQLEADDGRPRVTHHAVRATHLLHLDRAGEWAKWVVD